MEDPMRTVLYVSAVLIAFSATATAQTGTPFEDLLRGDANNSSSVGVEDIVFIQNYLFYGGSTPTCLDAADVNDDGAIDISDASYLCNFLYLGGSQPPNPYPNCGQDPTADNLNCVASACP
jgi:hypothetical protein